MGNVMEGIDDVLKLRNGRALWGRKFETF